MDSQQLTLAQNTNHYIYSDRLSLICVSSIEGLNRFDGINIKLYKFNLEQQFISSNIQSSFFEDELNRFWFSTYEALHVYIPEKDDLEYQQFWDSNGELIESDYKVFHIEGENLYFKAGDEFFKYDICLRKVIQRWLLNIRNSHEASVVIGKDLERLYYALEDTLYWLDLKRNTTKPYFAKLESPISYLLCSSGLELFVGLNNGEFLHWDNDRNKIVTRSKISTRRISGMCYFGNKSLIVSDGDQLLFYDVEHKKVRDTLILYDKEKCNQQLKNLIIPYVDSDSILWIGSDGYGVVSSDLKKSKFKHINLKDRPHNVTGVFPWRSNRIISVTRKAEVGYYNSRFNQWEDLVYPKDQTISSSFIKASLILPNDVLVLADWDYLMSFDLIRKKYSMLTPKNQEPLQGFLEFKAGPDGRIYALTFNKGIVEFQLEGNQYTWKNIPGINLQSKPFTLFDLDSRGNIYLGYNDETVLFYKHEADGSYKFVYEFNIAGGVKDISESKNKGHVYLANNNGLFDLDIHQLSYTVIQSKDKSLNQVLYCAIPDTAGFLWMSSNSGILRYCLKDSTVHQFKEKDGIQGYEYNTFAYLQDSNDIIYMGGVNGLNSFNPYKIKLSTKKAPVNIYSFKINDVETKKYGAANTLYTLALPYSENTISFEFLAIDYNDPEATRVKYKMEGVDKDFITASDVKGFARYANLKPDKYRFLIKSANADQVWNDELRVISISIIPPFWMTWWFRLLSIFSILSLGYWILREYYYRQLEKKDLILREQKLIIDKQQAIEKERSRIASEMHDDLGSGLTTIRYLSDRALKNAGTDEEKNQISKIASQSNSLIRNMSEIIWALNTRNDTTGNLLAYLRRYASEFLEEHQIHLQWLQEGIPDNQKLSGEVRRNVHLTVKEALNNIAKHSHANEVIINSRLIGGNIVVSIMDNGIGFDPSTKLDSGNGLYNMQKRMEQIKGHLDIHKKDKGMEVVLHFPIS